jgi:hypothetical protein
MFSRLFGLGKGAGGGGGGGAPTPVPTLSEEQQRIQKIESLDGEIRALELKAKPIDLEIKYLITRMETAYREIEEIQGRIEVEKASIRDMLKGMPSNKKRDLSNGYKRQLVTKLSRLQESLKHKQLATETMKKWYYVLQNQNKIIMNRIIKLYDQINTIQTANIEKTVGLLVGKPKTAEELNANYKRLMVAENGESGSPIKPQPPQSNFVTVEGGGALQLRGHRGYNWQGNKWVWTGRGAQGAAPPPPPPGAPAPPPIPAAPPRPASKSRHAPIYEPRTPALPVFEPQTPAGSPPTPAIPLQPIIPKFTLVANIPNTAALEMPPPASIFAKGVKGAKETNGAKETKGANKTRKNKPPPPSSAYASIYSNNAAFRAPATFTNKSLKNNNKNSAKYAAQELVIAWMDAEKEQSKSEKATALLQKIWDNPAALAILRSLA